MTPEGRATWRTSGTQTFAGSDVALIHRSDLSTDARKLVYSAHGPFQPLQGRLKVGQKALVLTSSGRTISGKVTELSPSSLVLTNGSIRQIIDASEVAIVKKPGPIWDGAVKGGAIGWSQCGSRSAAATAVATAKLQQWAWASARPSAWASMRR